MKNKNEDRKPKNEKFGIFLSLLTEFTWTINGISLKYLTKKYNLQFKNKSFIFARGLATIIISLILGKINDGKIYKLSEFSSKTKRYILMRASLNFFSICCWSLAVFYLRISTAQIISTLSPILVIIFSVIFLKEEYHSRYAFGIISGIIGSSIIILNEKKLRPSKTDSNFYEILIGVISIIINISLSSITSVMSKIMVKDKISTYAQMLYLGIIHCSYAFLWMLFTKDFNFNLGYFCLCSFQAVLFFMGNYFFLWSLKYNDLSKHSIFQYIKVVFVLILGFVLLNEKIFITDIIG